MMRFNKAFCKYCKAEMGFVNWLNKKCFFTCPKCGSLSPIKTAFDKEISKQVVIIMTITELYEWAIDNYVENYDISVLGTDGCFTGNIEPCIRDDVMEVGLQKG